MNSAAKKIRRPRNWNDKAHKAAFENLGKYVTDALTRDVLIGFEDSSLRSENFMRPSNVPLEVWHEALDLFAREGFIVLRWKLEIPKSLTKPEYVTRSDWKPEDNIGVPNHGPSGESLEKSKHGAISGEVPDSAPFMPGLLTGDQKNELIGKPYKLHATGGYTFGGDPEESIIVEEKHFSKIYYRDRKLFSDKDLEKGAEKLTKILSMSK